MKTKKSCNIFLIIFAAVIIILFSACPDIQIPKHGHIPVAVLQDGTPYIENESLILDSSDPDRHEIYIFIKDWELYDANSIIWWISGTEIRAQVNVFHLESYWFENPGYYYINLLVKINSVPYSNVFNLLVLAPSAGED